MEFYFPAIGIAMLFVMLSKMPLMIAQHQDGGYNNRNPRTQQNLLTGWGKRALAAHQNTIESLPLFATGILTGHLMSVPAGILNTCAELFLATRLVYIVLYLADQHLARSTIWATGFLASLYPILYGGWNSTWMLS